MMMINSTQVSHFTLGAYFDTGPLRYLYFLLILTCYLWICCCNVLLIVVISVTRSLHEPMYLFLLSLFVNELYGSTGLFPLLLVQILSDVHTVSASLCFLQIFCLYSYGGVEFATLAAMSYDRYLAICHPLQYHARMSLGRIAALTVLIWLYPLQVNVLIWLYPLQVNVLIWLYPLLVNVLIVFGLTAPLRLCRSVINKVYCDNHYVVRLACGDTTVNNVFGLTHMFTVIFGLILLIVYTYVRILRVCFSGCKQSRQRALSTCTPHLVSLINFSVGCFFEIVQSRFHSYTLPNMLRIFLSLYWLTCQPLVTPLLYGLKMSKIRSLVRSLLSGEKT